MIDILRSLLNTITSVVEFFTHAISSFVNLLMAIPRFTAYIFALVNGMIPDILKPFIILSVLVGIILLILGRN